MKTIVKFITLGLVLLCNNTKAQPINHQIEVQINIEKHSLKAMDKLVFTKNFIDGNEKIVFYLNKNLKITNITELKINKIESPEKEIYSQYSVNSSDLKSNTLTLKYEGIIFDNFGEGGVEYARGFSETSGIIDSAGVYLSGATYWIPTVDGIQINYSIKASLPQAWDMVSQGDRTVTASPSSKLSIVNYNCTSPQEEVYLIAAKFTIYEQHDGNVLLQAFLRTADKDLAERYLSATKNYLKMYQDMLGEYPYSKFALVENFWETGYGMPSFTLLGEKIIRFPFIINSSYPHELLHNYWGNSVYVDLSKGNWCEGITAYMADHLLQEQKGLGADYRRNTLQKFTDFVNTENDFPLNKFLNRHNSAEEAIGYGKCLMMNHMLRKNLGDEIFLKSYRKFYKDNKFKNASFDDIRIAFEETANTDLKDFFNLWIDSKGAPSIQLYDVATSKGNNSYSIGFKIKQTQKDNFFKINIPVAIYFSDTVVIKNYLMDKPEIEFNYQSSSEPLKIEIDPEFDVFRTLDRAEVPPTLSQVFGSKVSIIILPSKSKFLANYEQMAKIWKETQESQANVLVIKYDNELSKLPLDTTFWVFGFENNFAEAFTSDSQFKVFSNEHEPSNIQPSESVVMVKAFGTANMLTNGFVATYNQKAVEGLGRLLPHYGKYSYLKFTGDRPDNIKKGNFSASHSPLHFSFPNNKTLLGNYVKIIPEKALVTP